MEREEERRKEGKKKGVMNHPSALKMTSNYPSLQVNLAELCVQTWIQVFSLCLSLYSIQLPIGVLWPPEQ